MARSAWSCWISGASSASATRTGSGRWSWAGCRSRAGAGGPNDGGLWSGEDAGWCLSSETASLDIVGAEYVRDVEPGEIVVLEPGKEPRSVRYAEPTPALCVFELIYFARPDSYMEGRNLYEARRRMGEELAGEHAIDADMVIPVPDTGAPAAAGYAEASGLPYREGMYRNRYAGRTFIQPSQGMRHRGVTIKLNPMREVVAGKRLIVVDDSIVRGTTTKRIVELLRRGGRARSTSASAPHRSTTRASTASIRPWRPS